MEQTLQALLESRKNEEIKGITFIFGDKDEVFISYKELYKAASNILYELQERGYQPGDEVIFQITDNQKFIYSFWACQLGNMIPVPVTTGNNDEHKMKFFKIWNILSNPRVITSMDFLERIEKFAKEHDMIEQFKTIQERAFCYEEVTPSIHEGRTYPQDSEGLAFIQFSSGSTGDPKGVMITHKNFFVNVVAAMKWMKMTEQDVCLNWMPLTHDMGLIGTHLKSVYLNIHQYNIHTNLFIRRPQLWMKKASEHKATLLYSPNFGYKYFLKYFREKGDLDWDLSAVRMFYNGAEPISLELCEEFLEKLAPYGLKKNTMHPVYGLAEGTIAVTFSPLNSEVKKHIVRRNHLNIGETIVPTTMEDKQAIVFADEGYPIENCYTKICDEDGQDIGEHKIGYIYIRGGNVTKGYYNNEEETKRVIDEEGWLNTSDLGFMQDGRLTITGRAKDIIFIHGQNYYSHDIERVAEECEGVDMGNAVAIGAFNEEGQRDELILFLAHKGAVPKFVPYIKRLKEHIYERMGVRVDYVLPVRRIYKTTSGKVQRYKFREQYAKGEYIKIQKELEAMNCDVWTNREIMYPANETEEKLLSIWEDIFERHPISTEDDFFSLGGDSLKVTQLISRMQETFQTQMDYNELFVNATIKSQATYIENEKQDVTSKEIPELKKYTKGDYPLSFSQQRMWFLDNLNNGSPQYNLCKGMWIQGGIDVSLLEQSINQVASRHNILKMSFTEEKGIPKQSYQTDVRIKVETTNLTAYTDEEGEKIAIRKAKEIAKTPFDLSNAPLIRAHVFLFGKEETFVVFSTHHIIFDGWSLGIAMKELFYTYDALCADSQFTIKKAEYQYVDFANWQATMLEQPEYAKQLEYWKRQLQSEYHPISLPFNKQRPAVQTYHGHTIIHTVSNDVRKQVQIYAKKTKTTPFMVLLSTFEVLMYRYSLEREFAIGTSVANRNKKETEEIIGFFTNNLVLRASIKENDTFETLLQATKKTTLEAFEHQDIPFDKLVEELHVVRDMSMNPLFQVMFTMQNTYMAKLSIGGKEGTYYNLDTNCARFDLAVDVHETDHDLQFVYEYNTDLFEDTTIAHLAENYNQTLEYVLQHPKVCLEDVDILSRNEKEEVLSSYNKAERNFETSKGVVELFEQQAKEQPDKVAVKCGNESICYEELNRKANQVAHELRTHGIGRESIVAIYLDRSIDLLIAILGIYKVGAAYLPMDPIFPPNRLSYMMKDSLVEYIISQEAMVSTLPKSEAKVIVLNETFYESNLETTNVTMTRSEHDLAYILYTSGSTGNPKGVQLEQAGLLNFLLSMQEIIGIQRKDHWLAVTTISFDISILELLLPIISGATVIIAKREDVFDGTQLLDLIAKEDISIMQATPATWKLMLAAGFDRGNHLKILCGGEALPKVLAEELITKGKELINLYGPTETTIWSTFKSYEKTVDKITIGLPIANTSVYVLDQKLHPVPIGVPGELFLGGIGLARGYLHLEELTKEKFIDNPFKGEIDPSERLYRTGDRVKLLLSGELEYIERMDNQVKIRGFRIELEEIQTILSSHPLVKECVVAVKETKQKENIIAAYMILKEGVQKEKITPEQVRTFLKEKLPEYMIPTAFVVMDEFPLTLNKKVDMKSLPDPFEHKIVLTKEYEEATNEVETVLSDIWKEVLQLPQVGIKDNFFDLGGYSMLLAQVRSEILERLHQDVPMIELFKYPTIQSLAKYLSTEEEVAVTLEEKENPNIPKNHSHDIAIIGMSGRFPGANNIDAYWKNLCSGKETITRFDKEEAIKNGASQEEVESSEYVTAWGVLDEIDTFDAKFFGYNPKEATVLDPQQRIFLEEVWKAFETSGYNPQLYEGLIGVYASVGMNTYMEQLKAAGYLGSLANDYQVMTSNDKDFLATRVSYKLNLKGPSVTVQTACSSSLVALHHACKSLRDYECDMAVAGGVSIRMPQKRGYLYQEGMILSKDGHCRAFDQEAGGTVGGNGAGVVILKRLEDAMKDQDEILAVVKGSAINNDGAQKIGYTAPSVQGQARVIHSALKESGQKADQISYIEAHGTGTSLGDPIELDALTQAYRVDTKRTKYCAIGSVKTNIGHLDAAAGISGLIKTVLCVKHRQIPPSLHYHQPNKAIDFEHSPFYVNTKLQPYTKENPMCAGVSSFGIGGTNVHVILQEPPKKETETTGQKASYLVPLSAKSEQQLRKKIEDLKEYLLVHKDIELKDMAYTLQLGRKEFEYRYCFVGDTMREVIREFDAYLQEPMRTKVTDVLPLRTKELKEPKRVEPKILAKEWMQGASVAWSDLYQDRKARRVPLPVYPFEKTVYWPNVKESIGTSTSSDRNKSYTEFFYAPVWERSVEALNVHEDSNTVFVLVEESHPLVSSLVQELRLRGHKVYSIKISERYLKQNEFEYECNPFTDFPLLFKELEKELGEELYILPMFGFHVGQHKEIEEFKYEVGEDAYVALLKLAKAIGAFGRNLSVQLKVITNGMQTVLREKHRKIEYAMLLGAVKVIPLEYPKIRCTSIDMDWESEEQKEVSVVTELLIEDVFSDSSQRVVAYRQQTRFIQTYQKMKVTDGEELQSKTNQTKANGMDTEQKEVYLVTGGLGGVGLSIALKLLHLGKPTLVFMQRREFIKEQEWKNYLTSNEAQSIICEKIKILQTLKEQGMQVQIVKGDVSSEADCKNVREWIKEHYGNLTGILHAAGSAGGGMIQGKERETSKNVFTAKVQGTNVLYQVFKEEQIKRMILFSSLNAITGGFGQSDYSAANAYLDAFANAFDKKNGIRILSIDWERWPGIGMAQEGLDTKEFKRHPLLGTLRLSDQRKWVFYRCFDPTTDWALSEHHVFQIPTIAGTTYLEMARAAYEQVTNEEQSVIEDVVFLAPLAVPFGEKRNVMTILEQKEGQYEFVIASCREQSEESFVEHAKGKVSGIAKKEEGQERMIPLSDLQQKTYERTVKAIQLWGENNQSFIAFGERWKTLQWLSTNKNEAFAKILLQENYVDDFIECKLHPSVLDVATGALRFVSGGNYLPFNYQSITMKKNLEREIYSHLMFKTQMDETSDFITCDINLYNKEGEVLVEIRNFSMRLVETKDKLNYKERKDTTIREVQYRQVWSVLEKKLQQESNIFAQGLTKEEGQNIFAYLYQHAHLAQVVISKKDVTQAIEQADYLKQLTNRTKEEDKIEQSMHERPELKNAYAPCRNETEERIKDIWEPLLAIEGIGIHDEFFELGGDSLLLIQLHTKLKEAFRKEFPVVDLYKYNTIALQAKLLCGESMEEKKPSFDEVNDRVKLQRKKMQQRRNQIQRKRDLK